MRHAIPYRKLSRQRSHYRALLRNLAFSLFEHEKIRTTESKAKEVRRFVDKLVTLGKSGTLHDRRRALALIGNKVAHTAGGEKVDIIGKLFKELAPRLAAHKGGYTRITRLHPRPGDAAQMVLLELVKLSDEAKKPKKRTVSDTTSTDVKAAS